MKLRRSQPEIESPPHDEELPRINTKAATVDWLTVTCKDPDLQYRVFHEAGRLATIQKERGNVQKPWSFKGYKGWAIEGLRWGAREDSSIVMLSGQAASLNWPTMLAWAGNVTRLDLAVTIDLVTPLKHRASEAYGILTMDGQVEANRGSRKYSLVVNSAGGETLYVGSRASDQFGRLYDKGREQTDDLMIPTGKIWRYEVEFKGDRASRVGAQMLESAKRDEGPATEDIGQTVYKWFLSRGIAPIWKPDKGQEYSTEVYAKLSDDDLTLQWLATGVSPSVARLMDNGRGTEVLNALGITAD
jgi:hypothetical protein